MPSLVALRAFESVGRTGSVRAAGEELAVSHTAISRHIKNLQHDLGIMLVRPNGRGVSLTEEGCGLFTKISQSFDTIEGAVAAARPAKRTAVRIWCAPGIANRRLLARLPELTAPPRSWEVTMIPTLQRPDLNRREADAEIIYSEKTLETHQAVSGTACELIARPRVFPVASPAFIARYPKLRAPKDLATAALIHEESTDQWSRWLKLAGVPMDGELPGQRLWHAHLAVEAARLGHGLALANEILVQDETRSGALVEPFPSQVYLGSYVFVVLKDRWFDPVIVALRDWLRRALASGLVSLDHQSQPTNSLSCRR